MDEDTLLEVKLVRKDGDGDETGITVPMTFTLGQLRDWLLDNGVAAST